MKGEQVRLNDDVIVVLDQGYNKASGSTYTKLLAYQSAKSSNYVEMRVDKVAPHNYKVYLAMMIREIQRCRDELTEKPKSGVTNPRTIKSFVRNMAVKGMFKFGASNDITGDTTISETGGDMETI